MTANEHLAALIKKAAYISLPSNTSEEHLRIFTNYLLAHGVRVQEWISVKDRLPEKNTSVLASTDNGIVFQCLYAYDGWDLWEGHEVNITHWQPMPQPPKGE